MAKVMAEIILLNNIVFNQCLLNVTVSAKQSHGQGKIQGITKKSRETAPML
jgi:hypothetical protein